MPGNRPHFFNVLGILTEFVTIKRPSGKYGLHIQAMKLSEKLVNLYKKEHLFCIWFLYTPVVLLIKANGIKEIYKSNKEIEKGPFYELGAPVFGQGLITSPACKWRERRKLMNPCFHPEILRGFLTFFNERSIELVNNLQQETKKDFIDPKKYLTDAAMDIICETMFGVSVGAQKNMESEYVEAVESLADIFMCRIYKPWHWPFCMFRLTGAYREGQKSANLLFDLVARVIEEKKRLYLKGRKDFDGRKRKAMLDLLLEYHFDSEVLSEEDIKEEVITFVLAGHETAASTMLWALFLIGHHQDIQDKIHDELDRVFGEDVDRYVSECDLNELNYLENVIKETLRIYPTVPIFGRQIQEERKICGHTIPKKTSCFVLAYYLHRDEDVFPDPEKFDPDRFLPENAAKIPDFAYMPFSAGPRNCIGQKFALMEMKIFLSFILRNYSVKSLDPMGGVQLLMNVTLHPSVPLRISIRTRSRQD
ncbi:cytochrome P450 4V2 [Nephila pilipes]|uniref:Cytochrome P450 4V2 n=1 Tax=Nephila pilipes TaxID=299642 RepID=A0A8X6MS46_NEPPI|nr:cytochrome P450 4V2 [Nephila pilipes]